MDRIAGWLLLLGGFGHALGSIQVYKADPMTLLWALCGTLFAWLLAAVNLLRASRATDRALTWVCLIGNLAWIAVSLRFGALMVNIFDPRSMIFVVITTVLCGFCLRSLLRAAPDRARPS